MVSGCWLWVEAWIAEDNYPRTNHSELSIRARDGPSLIVFSTSDQAAKGWRDMADASSNPHGASCLRIVALLIVLVGFSIYNAFADQKPS
jgi:hypothetical protein